MPNSVLIFGANGFVGGYLAKEFKDNGYLVYGSDRAMFSANEYLIEYRTGDLSDGPRIREICDDLQPDIVVNLAAVSSVGQSWAIPQTTIEVNVNGTLNILDAVREMKDSPKILLVGSSEEYSPSSSPLNEFDKIDATNPYGISKVTQERFADLYAKRFGLRIYRTRSFNHTGIGQADNFVLSSWCKQAAIIKNSGKPGTIKVGNLEVVRDFTDVRDVANAYRLYVESDYSGIVLNIGSGKGHSLGDLLRQIIGFDKLDVSIEVNQDLIRPTDVPCIVCNNDKARRLLDWDSKIDISDTLHGMYEDYLRRTSQQVN